RRRHTRLQGDWSSDVCSSDLAVAEIHNPQQDLKAGEWAYLSHEDTDALVEQRSLSATRKYPAVISFTEGDPLEEEIRAEVPRPQIGRASCRERVKITGGGNAR